MKGAELARILIFAAAVVLGALRIGFRARRRRQERGRQEGSGQDGRRQEVRRWEGRWRPALLESDTGLVAGRELKERVRARSFRIVTGLVLLAVGAAIVIPSVTKSKGQAQQIGVLGPLSATERGVVLAAAKRAGIKARVVPEASGAAAREALRTGQIDLAVIDGQRVEVKRAIASNDTSSTAQLVRTIATELGIGESFSAARLTPAQIVTVAGAKPLPIVSLERASPSRSHATGAAIIGVIIIFVMLSQYETWTLIGVMEEKASRVVEVLLATVRPIELLGGKVLGIGMVAMAQAVSVLAFALILAKVVGSSVLQGTAPLMLAAALLWLVVGYAFYCWVYAAAGSLAERQDQVQTMALPLSLPMILGYVMALTAAGTNHASLFFQVLGYLPPTAPFAMPVLVGLGVVSWWEFSASVLISIACTVAVARGAAAVYRRAVLRTGRRVHLREVLIRARA